MTATCKVLRSLPEGIDKALNMLHEYIDGNAQFNTLVTEAVGDGAYADENGLAAVLAAFINIMTFSAFKRRRSKCILLSNL